MRGTRELPQREEVAPGIIGRNMQREPGLHLGQEVAPDRRGCLALRIGRFGELGQELEGLDLSDRLDEPAGVGTRVGGQPLGIARAPMGRLTGGPGVER